MVKSYLASTTATGEATKDEQRVESISREVTSMAVQGAAREESWTSPGGTLFVLMVVDGPTLRSAVSSSAAPAEVKAALTEGSEKLLGEE